MPISLLQESRIANERQNHNSHLNLKKELLSIYSDSLCKYSSQELSGKLMMISFSAELTAGVSITVTDWQLSELADSHSSSRVPWPWSGALVKLSTHQCVRNSLPCPHWLHNAMSVCPPPPPFRISTEFDMEPCHDNKMSSCW